jgi:hypothetical protein
MTNDSRPVDLLSDSKGVYGIGIVYDDLIQEERGCDKHLIFRPDVIAESAFFPMENREALLQTLPKHCSVPCPPSLTLFSSGFNFLLKFLISMGTTQTATH